MRHTSVCVDSLGRFRASASSTTSALSSLRIKKRDESHHIWSFKEYKPLSIPSGLFVNTADCKPNLSRAEPKRDGTRKQIVTVL